MQFIQTIQYENVQNLYILFQIGILYTLFIIITNEWY